ncbi:hypothetical protein [Sciscionella marina]|uniref:hypothetical protein n=1 Tax=Sciscionella marina TaxID=508770 RepID=UPI0012F6D2CF|nr:hypothetical protein [Sciscionella marina]
MGALRTVLPVEPATAEHLAALHGLRRRIEDRLHDRRIRQWPRGEVPPERIAAQLSRGEWHVLRRATGVAAVWGGQIPGVPAGVLPAARVPRGRQARVRAAEHRAREAAQCSVWIASLLNGISSRSRPSRTF